MTVFAEITNPILFRLAVSSVFVLGAVFVIAGYYLRTKTRRLLGSALIAKSTVIGFETSMSPPGQTGVRHKVFYPIFTFRDAQGTEYRVRSGAGFAREKHKVGELIDVFYQPESPQQAIIDPKEYVQMAWILILSGIGAMVLAAAVLLKVQP